MRTPLSRLMTLGFALVALFAGLIQTQAQDVTLLHMTNSNWRYYQFTNEPPNVANINWRQTNYNDAAGGSLWQTGRGVFGEEPGTALPAQIHTPLNLIQPGALTNNISYYFRTTFNYGQSPAGVELVFTNLLDDGAVVYLNGTEIYRYRITGTPTYTTQAGNQATEGVFEINSVVNSPALRQGNNTLAVEVHQSGTASSDVVFGLAVAALRPSPIVITDQPESQLLAVGDPLVLSVGVSGSNPIFQWFRNSLAIGSATNATYSLTSVTAANAGTYYVRVSNSISTNTSQSAIIQIVADTFGPEPLLALVEETETDVVTITFDDAIARINTNIVDGQVRSATNANNYSIQIVGEPATVIPIETIAVSAARVRLTLNYTWDRSKLYYITFNRITDTDFNPIARATQIGVQFRVNTNILQYSRDWLWAGMFESNLPPSWTSLTNYQEDPEIWFLAPGPLYYESDGNDVTCMGPIFNGSGNGTQVPNYFSSYYFRYKLIIPTNFNLAETTWRMTYVLDDGAVFYVNGAEVYRTNMPAGPPSFNTVAVGNYEANLCRSNNLAGTTFRHGTNIIAVHVSQGPNPAGDGFDIAFGLAIDAATTQGLDLPRLNHQRLAPLTPGGPVREAISWIGTGWALQQTSTPQTTNSWANVTPAPANAYTNTTAGRYFRLRKQ